VYLFSFLTFHCIYFSFQCDYHSLIVIWKSKFVMNDIYENPSIAITSINDYWLWRIIFDAEVNVIIMLLCTAFRLVSTTFDILGCIVEMTNILKLFYKLHTVSSLHKSYVTNYAPAHLTSIVIQAMHCWNIVAFSSSNSRICFIIISDEPHCYIPNISPETTAILKIYNRNSEINHSCARESQAFFCVPPRLVG